MDTLRGEAPEWAAHGRERLGHPRDLTEWAQVVEREMELWLPDYKGTVLKTVHPETEVHQQNVAGLTAAMLHGIVPESSLPHMAALLAARHHDLGKARPSILPLVQSTKKFTPEQRELMERHAVYGAEDFMVLFGYYRGVGGIGVLLNVVGFMITNHHTKPGKMPLPAIDDYAMDPAVMRETTAVLQLADKLEAMLSGPEKRPYRLERMRDEGLVRLEYGPAGELVVFEPLVPKITKMLVAETGLGGEFPALGARTDELVARGVHLMRGRPLTQTLGIPGLETYPEERPFGTLDSGVLGGVGLKGAYA